MTFHDVREYLQKIIQSQPLPLPWKGPLEFGDVVWLQTTSYMDCRARVFVGFLGRSFLDLLPTRLTAVLLTRCRRPIDPIHKGPFIEIAYGELSMVIKRYLKGNFAVNGVRFSHGSRLQSGQVLAAFDSLTDDPIFEHLNLRKGEWEKWLDWLALQAHFSRRTVDKSLRAAEREICESSERLRTCRTD